MSFFTELNGQGGEYEWQLSRLSSNIMSILAQEQIKEGEDISILRSINMLLHFLEFSGSSDCEASVEEAKASFDELKKIIQTGENKSGNKECIVPQIFLEFWNRYQKQIKSTLKAAPISAELTASHRPGPT